MPTYTIHGQVINTHNDQPLSQATIRMTIPFQGTIVYDQTTQIEADSYFHLSFDRDFLEDGMQASFEVIDEAGNTLPTDTQLIFASNTLEYQLNIFVSPSTSLYHLNLAVLDREAQRPLSGLSAEAWDKDSVRDDALGTQTTDGQGMAYFEFDASVFDDRGSDLAPDVYFRIRDGEQIVYDGLVLGEIHRNLPAGTHDFSIEISLPTPRVGRYKVSGMVYDPQKQPFADMQLIILDVDLRGAAVYDGLNSLEELQAAEGLESLASTSSNESGYYEAFFSRTAFEQHEIALADVIAYAIRNGAILGRSRLAFKKDYVDNYEIKDLDITIDREVLASPSEYARLIARVEPFVQQSGLSLAALHSSPQQQAFLAKELEEALSKIQVLIAADVLITEAPEPTLFREMLYAIGRRQIELSWNALAGLGQARIRQILEEQSQANVVQKVDQTSIDTFVSWIETVAFDHLLHRSPSEDQAPLAEFFQIALPDQTEAHRELLLAYTNHQGSTSAFWEEVLPNLPSFQNRPEAIEALTLTNQLSFISLNHLPLVNELQLNWQIQDARELVYRQEELQQLLENIDPPPDIEGATPAERRANYSNHLSATLEAAYPTDSLAYAIQQDRMPISTEDLRPALVQFMERSIPEGFDIRSSRINAFAPIIQELAPAQADQLQDELEKMQRIMQVSPSSQAMATLLPDFDAVHDIASIPRATFISTYAPTLGQTEAEIVHHRARAIHDRNAFSIMNINERLQGISPVFISGNLHLPLTHENGEEGSNGIMSPAAEAISEHIPNWQELFGTFSYCECKHCRSVLSPAAYMVDLMHMYLDKGRKNQLILNSRTGISPLEVFLRRRPDIAHLELSCENTHTLIPYIDLVNEIMEYYVAYGQLTAETAQQTEEVTAEELQAQPQYIQVEAYQNLSQAVYPFDLPYHQPLDSIHVYLDHLKTSLFEVLQKLHPNPDESTRQAISSAYLKLSPQGLEIITGSGSLQLAQYYGYQLSPEGEFLNWEGEVVDWKEDISQVREFLQRTGLTYEELEALLQTQYINPFAIPLQRLNEIIRESTSELTSQAWFYVFRDIAEGSPISEDDSDLLVILASKGISQEDFQSWLATHFDGIRFALLLEDSAGDCNINQMQLQMLSLLYEDDIAEIPDDVFDRIHRFIRLWRRLELSMEELDLVLKALQITEINAATLEQLSGILQVQQRLKLSIQSLLLMWAEINTHGENSLYGKKLLNKSLQEINEVFHPDPLGQLFVEDILLVDDDHDHSPTILAAFQIQAVDLENILEVSGMGDREIQLNLISLSIIYRHVILARVLRLNIKECCTLINLVQTDEQLASSHYPFSTLTEAGEFTSPSPISCLNFIELVDKIKDSGFRIEHLSYLIEGEDNENQSYALGREAKEVFLFNLRDRLDIIAQTHRPETNVDRDILSEKLSLIFEPDQLSRCLSLVDDSISFSVAVSPDLSLTIPGSLVNKVSYFPTSGQIQFQGVMSSEEQEDLTALDPSLETAAQELFDAPYRMMEDMLYGIFENNFEEAVAVLLNRPAQPELPSIEDKYQFFYDHCLPFLQKRLSQDAFLSELTALYEVNEAALTQLVAEEASNWTAELSNFGLLATYLTPSGTFEQIDSQIDFRWSTEAEIPEQVHWEGWIRKPINESFTFSIELQDELEEVEVHINDERILARPAGPSPLHLEGIAARSLDLARLHKVEIVYRSNGASTAGIRFAWKAPTLPKEVIAGKYLFPLNNAFDERLNNWQKGVYLINGFKLEAEEIQHFQQYPADFDELDFAAISLASWQRLYDYHWLRQKTKTAQLKLVNLFQLAKLDTAPVSFDEVIGILAQLLAFPTDQVSLIQEYFTFTELDFQTEIAPIQIYEILALIRKVGVPIPTFLSWGNPSDDFLELHQLAQDIKRSTKAKYEDEIWLDLAPTLSDVLRENQKQALIAYLLVQPTLLSWGVRDANGLFAYFLIDVQMDACMDTSRIKQAISSLQLFVQRCFLNLESRLNEEGQEIGVQPDFLDRQEWEWVKNYRVWEANRKVLLYAENWALPEVRPRKSELFKQLESDLLKNDINPDSVEKAFKNYVNQLEEIGKLDVIAMLEENMIIHVIGRTSTKPYTYFYRTYHQGFQRWSPWEKIPIDIQGVESKDEITGFADSGVHLMPIVKDHRLFLIWPTFLEKVREQNNDEYESHWELIGSSPADNHPQQYWEVKLAWSEYKDGNWTPKQEFNNFHLTQSKIALNSLRFSSEFLSDVLTISFFDNPPPNGTTFSEEDGGESVRKEFAIGNVRQVVEANEVDRWFEPDDAYLPSFNKHRKIFGAQLDLKFRGSSRPTRFLHRGGVNFQLLFSHTNRYDLPFALSEYPNFFHQDTQRAFHVIPQQPATPLADSNWAREIGLGFVEERFRNTRGINRVFSDIGMQHTGATTSPSTARSIHYTSGNINFSALGSGSTPPSYSFSWEENGARLDPTLVTRLEFRPFFHPFANQLVEILNTSGVKGLLRANLELGEEGRPITLFEENYNPTNYVYPPYPKEKIAFGLQDAYSQYNWELFYYAPLFVAVQLSQNGKYAQAMEWFHRIFDPTTNEQADVEAYPDYPEERYWKLRPFKSELEDIRSYLANLRTEDPLIEEWRANPFQPHLIAQRIPNKYKKLTVMKYLDNLIAWGDQLFRQDTIESINEATQLYVLASHILGPKPVIIPKRGSTRLETYDTLKDRLDALSNAWTQWENLFPYTSRTQANNEDTPSNLLGAAPIQYFCIPPNDQLLSYWDTVADRLFKIRHCMNIEGIERQLALFQPPIDPGILINAVAQGLSIGSVLSDLQAPLPHHRFSFVLNKAVELCNECRAFAANLLAAIEKEDAEALSQLRAGHDVAIQNAIKLVREEQQREAEQAIKSLEKNWEISLKNFIYYQELLGESPIQKPQLPDPSSGQNPDQIVIKEISLNLDDQVVDTEESSVVLIPREAEEIDKSNQANNVRVSVETTNSLANSLHLIPALGVYVAPMGNGSKSEFGGKELGSAASAVAAGFGVAATMLSFDASQAARMSSHIRRTQEWIHQCNQTGRELKRIASENYNLFIRKKITEQELANQDTQINQVKEVEQFLLDKLEGDQKGKYTNKLFYSWMRHQAFSVYKQYFDLCYEWAKKAEKAYRFELGEHNNFIKYGLWDSSKEGLMAAEQLCLALRQMERSYLNKLKRDYELSKHISLSQIDPQALIRFKETGICEFSLPETIFDLDFAGHYFRRIKGLSITIPCVTGPFVNVNAKLTLLKDRTRIKALASTADEYSYQGVEDPNFKHNLVHLQSIVMSSGQRDTGLFEFNFRDERYLPFEGAGVISSWRLELPASFRQFDYNSISDVVLHLNYMAKEGGDRLKSAAQNHLEIGFNNLLDQMNEQGGMWQAFSLRQSFSSEWHRFLHAQTESLSDGTNNRFHHMSIEVEDRHFPYYLQEKFLHNLVDLYEVGLLLLPAKGTPSSDADGLLIQLTNDGSTIAEPIGMMSGNPRLGSLPSVSYSDPSGVALLQSVLGNWQFRINVNTPAEAGSNLLISEEVNGRAIYRLDRDKILDMLILMRVQIR